MFLFPQMNSLLLLLVIELEEAPLYEINAFAKDIFCTLCMQKLCAVETKNIFLLNSNEIVVSREELTSSPMIHPCFCLMYWGF